VFLPCPLSFLVPQVLPSRQCKKPTLVSSHQSPVTSPQSPVPSHQSPITNHQFPLFLRKAKIVN
ncbi:MAG: hypothetical protein ACKO2Z_35625, partial [Sphaerospermopsis kisseleviana]